MPHLDAAKYKWSQSRYRLNSQSIDHLGNAAPLALKFDVIERLDGSASVVMVCVAAGDMAVGSVESVSQAVIPSNAVQIERNNIVGRRDEGGEIEEVAICCP